MRVLLKNKKDGSFIVGISRLEILRSQKMRGVLGALYELANFWRKVAKVHPLYTRFVEEE